MPDLADRVEHFLKPAMESSSAGNVVAFPQTREKALLRIVGLLTISGHSVTEVAELTGVDEDKLKVLVQSPEIVALYQKQIELQGRFAMKRLTAGAAVDVLIMLTRMVNDSSKNDNVRLKAGAMLLDRAFGKPMPANSHQMQDNGGLTDGDLEAEERKLEAQINELLGARKKFAETKEPKTA